MKTANNILKNRAIQIPICRIDCIKLLCKYQPIQKSTMISYQNHRAYLVRVARLVCIFISAGNENKGSARSSPRRRRSSAPHFVFRVSLRIKNKRWQKPSLIFWSEWRDSNSRHPAPKKLWELFSNIFRSFLAPFIPEKLLFRTLVSTVSMCSKPGYGQICGQKPLP